MIDALDLFENLQTSKQSVKWKNLDRSQDICKVDISWATWQGRPRIIQILGCFLSKFCWFFDRQLIKFRYPKIDRNSNDFRQVSNTNLKPATCSKCRACQQKQGFGHLRSRSTIAIKSRSNVFEKRVVFHEKSRNFDGSEIEQLWRGTNWPHFV